jgi:hypothetical protein
MKIGIGKTQSQGAFLKRALWGWEAHSAPSFRVKITNSHDVIKESGGIAVRFQHGDNNMSYGDIWKPWLGFRTFLYINPPWMRASQFWRKSPAAARRLTLSGVVRYSICKNQKSRMEARPAKILHKYLL